MPVFDKTPEYKAAKQRMNEAAPEGMEFPPLLDDPQFHTPESTISYLEKVLLKNAEYALKEYIAILIKNQGDLKKTATHISELRNKLLTSNDVNSAKLADEIEASLNSVREIILSNKELRDNEKKFSQYIESLEVVIKHLSGMIIENADIIDDQGTEQQPKEIPKIEKVPQKVTKEQIANFTSDLASLLTEQAKLYNPLRRPRTEPLDSFIKTNRDIIFLIQDKYISSQESSAILQNAIYQASLYFRGVHNPIEIYLRDNVIKKKLEQIFG